MMTKPLNTENTLAHIYALVQYRKLLFILRYFICAAVGRTIIYLNTVSTAVSFKKQAPRVELSKRFFCSSSTVVKDQFIDSPFSEAEP